VATAKKPRYVDVANPTLAVDCPRCGLRTARFIDQCRNCSYKLWPSSTMASAAFKAWQAVDPARLEVSRFDVELPVKVDDVIDYEARAHQLGIHLFPSSNWPFIICFGMLFLALGAIPFAGGVRIGLAVVGVVIFLAGVVGWVLVEDVKMYPAESGPAGAEAHH
jgi:hypothetical protein